MPFSRRVRLRSSPALITALLGMSVLMVGAPTAVAAGTITGTVFMDYNANGKKDAGGFTVTKSVAATDTGVAGVTVKAYDAKNKVVGQATSDASGAYSLAVSTSEQVRVEFTTPSGYETSFEGSMSGTSVQFVKSGTTNVDYGIAKATEYCQDNPKIITCLQPASNQMDAFPAAAGIFAFPAAFNAAQTFTEIGSTDYLETDKLATGNTEVAAMTKIGATFGVGVDRGGNAYFGTYVKRHSPYGPAGATNTIYRVNIATGASEAFVRLGDEVLPAHSAAVPAATSYPPYSQDGLRKYSDPSSPDYAPANPNYSDVYFQVGRAGIGDVDVTTDGSALLAVEMTEAAPKLWRVPIIGSGASVTAGTATATPITAPTAYNGVSCIGNWHPMGIGQRGDRILVGGVCGGTETRFFDPAAGRTEAAAFVLEAKASGTGFGFETVAAFTLDYPKGGAGGGAGLAPLPVASSGRNDDDESGLWNNWHDGATLGQAYGYAKPMVANVEIMDNGDLTIAFRDRFFDQVKPCGTVWFDSTSPIREQGCNNGAAAEILRLCKTATGYEREQGGSCNGVTGANVASILLNAPNTDGATSRSNSPLYFGNPYGTGSTFVTHPYTGLGGVGTMPGSPVLWSTTYDPTAIYQQGVRALGPCAARTGNGDCGPAGAADGAMIGGTVLQKAPASNGAPAASYTFMKGNGLGDLELACDAAPVQIGNRVWIDTNKDGIQDPDEPPVKGVTARLYDASGALVGTSLTDEKGQYYFSSNVSQPAAGDGTNTGGGLTTGAEFTVRFDNKADYTAGGPLDGYSLTKANVTKAGKAVNSKATMVGGNPTIEVPARVAGENNHTYDVGFIKGGNLVAVGDYTWVDVNRDGLQNEQPLPGVKVTLLTTKGKRAKDADGKAVKTKTTNKRGYYVFDALNPGTYKVQFQIPAGMKFTRNSKKKDARDSNPIPTKANPQIGITPVFRVYAAVKGNTVRNKNSKLRASYIDPTIDAGVVFCAKTTLTPTTVQVGRSNRVTAKVTLAGRPFAKRKVTLSGNGVRMTATTNAKGIAVFTLSPDSAGSYTVRVSGESSTCQPQLLGAASGQNLTG